MPPPSPAPHILAINRADVHCVLYLQSCVWDRCFQFTVVAFNFNARSLYSAQIYFHKIIEITPSPPPCDAPLSKNDPPKRIKILKEKMSRPTRDTPLSDVGLLFSLCAYRAVPCGGAGRALPPVFLVWRHRDQSNGLSGPQTLCFSNTMSYLKFFAPLVSKGLLQPRLMNLQIPFWACVALK